MQWCQSEEKENANNLCPSEWVTSREWVSYHVSECVTTVGTLVGLSEWVTAVGTQASAPLGCSEKARKGAPESTHQEVETGWFIHQLFSHEWICPLNANHPAPSGLQPCTALRAWAVLRRGESGQPGTEKLSTCWHCPREQVNWDELRGCWWGRGSSTVGALAPRTVLCWLGESLSLFHLSFFPFFPSLYHHKENKYNFCICLNFSLITL